jgi:L-seryl-tRNA(Ser) seleniumtransferase
MENSQSNNGSETSNLYRLLPSVNDLLLTPDVAALLQVHSRSAVLDSSRAVLLRIKQQISDGRHTQGSLMTLLSALDVAITDELRHTERFSLRRVINATGVILHTNLGRAPLSTSALEHIRETAAGYSNLEFDLENGERSRRDTHAERLLLRLLKTKAGAMTGEMAEAPRAVVVVNNCAAATFLALNSIAEGTEVIVSRGELVEIGGGFRIPEILTKSGACLREVGTTNRTRLADYESAISPETGLILRVHQSNFSIEGFTARPALDELASLARRRNIPLFDDQGTGLLFSLDDLGVDSEPTLIDSFRFGSDLIAASGDKLLGGPQCGLLIGRVDLIERIRKNPLLRTFRVDKLTYAALEATLMDHLLDRADSIPIVKMLRATSGEISQRCEWIASHLMVDSLSIDIVPVQSLIGGGTAPTARLQSSAVALRHRSLSPQALLLALRRLDPPIIGRITEDNVLLDLSTVEPEFDSKLIHLLEQLAHGRNGSDPLAPNSD